MPTYLADDFHEYGHSSVNVLAQHFFQIETEKVQKLNTEKLLAERSHMKYHVNDNINSHFKEMTHHGKKYQIDIWQL